MLRAVARTGMAASIIFIGPTNQPHPARAHGNGAFGFPQPVCGSGIDLLEDLLSVPLDFRLQRGLKVLENLDFFECWNLRLPHHGKCGRKRRRSDSQRQYTYGHSMQPYL